MQFDADYSAGCIQHLIHFIRDTDTKNLDVMWVSIFINKKLAEQQCGLEIYYYDHY